MISSWVWVCMGSMALSSSSMSVLHRLLESSSSCHNWLNQRFSLSQWTLKGQLLNHLFRRPFWLFWKQRLMTRTSQRVEYTKLWTLNYQDFSFLTVKTRGPWAYMLSWHGFMRSTLAWLWGDSWYHTDSSYIVSHWWWIHSECVSDPDHELW